MRHTGLPCFLACRPPLRGSASCSLAAPHCKALAQDLRELVSHISGITVQETIPDWVVQQAQEVVMVDLTPRAALVPAA
jgi:hypothetical protein